MNFPYIARVKVDWTWTGAEKQKRRRVGGVESRDTTLHYLTISEFRRKRKLLDNETLHISIVV